MIIVLFCFILIDMSVMRFNLVNKATMSYAHHIISWVFFFYAFGLDVFDRACLGTIFCS